MTVAKSSDGRKCSYEAQVASAADYHPFGWEMPGRKYNSQEYRYGFNGKEKDDDGEFGSITNYDYGFRIYNPAVGRFLSVDPLSPSYSMLTPYQFASNTPIAASDLDGLEAQARTTRAARTSRTQIEINRENQRIIARYTRVRNQRLKGPFGDNSTVVANPNTNHNIPTTFNLAYLPQRKVSWGGGQTYLAPEGVSGYSFSQMDDMTKYVTRSMNVDALLELDASNSIKRYGRKDDAYYKELLQRTANDLFLLTLEEHADLSAYLKGKGSRAKGDYFGRQGVYVIKKDGEIWKFGKAHLEGKLDEEGRPKRLTDQLRDLENEFPDAIFSGEVIEDFKGTTKEAEDVELEYIEEFKKQNGVYPKGNENDNRVKNKKGG